MLFNRNHHVPMMPDANGGAGGGAADEVEVDLPSGKVRLPKAAAEIVIKGRDALKEEHRKLAERLGTIESDRKAAEDAKRKAEEDKAMSEAAKAGEIEKVKQIAGQQLSRLSDRYRDRALEGHIAKLPGVLPQAVADIATQLRSGCRFDPEADTLVVVDAAGRPVNGADGKPMGVDAFVSSYLEARPWFRAPNGTPGSGAAGTPTTPASTQVKRSEYEANPGKYGPLAAAGKVQIVD